MNRYYLVNREKILKQMRDYYVKNKDKISLRRKKYTLEYYALNKENIKEKVKNNLKRTNYKYEKTPKQRKIRYVKRRTRLLFPLNNTKCKFCENIATEHHHNTFPIEFNKFDYVCHICHLIQQNNYKGVEK